MTLRLSTFQPLLRGTSPLLRAQQRRWAQVHDVRFLATHHDPKHVQDKYRMKLDQKAKQYGRPIPKNQYLQHDGGTDELRKKEKVMNQSNPSKTPTKIKSMISAKKPLPSQHQMILPTQKTSSRLKRRPKNHSHLPPLQHPNPPKPKPSPQQPSPAPKRVV